MSLSEITIGAVIISLIAIWFGACVSDATTRESNQPW